ncbi:MAG: NAD-dependent malic enzyme, partial [Gemmatimonadetes bacterium]|nr:NAD-dependent malic enzyme [Gemmatimonadota bacterium]
HGTAVVVLAGLINALKIVQKRPEDLKLAMVGAGAAGNACAKTLLDFGVKNIIPFDRQGAVSRNRDYGDNDSKRWLAEHTNPGNVDCALGEGLRDADCFLGLAGPGLVTRAQVATMAPDAIVFAMANPVPEIMPEEVPDNVRVMATGRTDYPNQINNALCFPGLYRGVLDVLATDINDEMKVAAARAIASVIPDERLSEDYIIPSMFDEKVASSVAREVARVAIQTGVARRSGPHEGKDYSAVGAV